MQNKAYTPHPTYSGFLKVTYGTSRGRDTYGYNLVTVVDSKNNKRYRQCGGGYDMRGAALADWMEDCLQDELLAYLQSCGMVSGERCSNGDAAYKTGYPYGAYITKAGVAGFDGACGVESVRKCLEGMGYSVTSSGYNNRLGNYVHEGYFISPTNQQ